MKPKFREKTDTGYLCTRYDCKFTSPDFCKKRAEINIAECLACTGTEPEKKRKSSNLEFCVKRMKSKQAA
jgi:hypothetical protein